LITADRARGGDTVGQQESDKIARVNISLLEAVKLVRDGYSRLPRPVMRRRFVAFETRHAADIRMIERVA